MILGYTSIRKPPYILWSLLVLAYVFVWHSLHHLCWELTSFPVFRGLRITAESIRIMKQWEIQGGEREVMKK